MSFRTIWFSLWLSKGFLMSCGKLVSSYIYIPWRYIRRKNITCLVSDSFYLTLPSSKKILNSDELICKSFGELHFTDLKYFSVNSNVSHKTMEKCRKALNFIFCHFNEYIFINASSEITHLEAIFWNYV